MANKGLIHGYNRWHILRTNNLSVNDIDCDNFGLFIQIHLDKSSSCPLVMESLGTLYMYAICSMLTTAFVACQNYRCCQLLTDSAWVHGYFATITTPCIRIHKVLRLVYRNTPDTAPSELKVHRGRQDPGGPHVGPMNHAIRALLRIIYL